MNKEQETVLQRIERISHCHPTECSCERCRQMCHVPCLGTPEDIERLVDAGYADRLCPTEWLVGQIAGLCDSPIAMLQANQRDGWCSFYHNGLCELHDKGLKPTEGKLTRHDDQLTFKGQPLTDNVTWLVAKEWIQPENFPTIVRICEKIKHQRK